MALNCTNPEREHDKICSHSDCRWWMPWEKPGCKDCTLKPCCKYERVDDSSQLTLELF